MHSSRALAIVAVALVGIALRLPSLRVQFLNEDEALYATAAAAMQEGEPPYRAGVESKPPGIFYLYRAGFALVGRYHLEALHALTIAWVLATALFVALIAARVAGGKGALWAALLYLVFTTVQEPSVLATQCELLYSLPLAIAAWILLGERGGNLGNSALAGASCALATLIKPTAASLPIAAGLWLLVVLPLAFHRRELRAALGLGAGFGAVWLLAAAWFRHLGVWDELVYWAFRWTSQMYIPTGFATFSWLSRFAGHVGPWAAAVSALLFLAGRAAIRARRRGPEAGSVSLLVLWALAAFGMVLLGGRFFDHYFPALITPLAALGGIGAASLELGWRRASSWLVALGTALPAVACFVMALNFDAAMKLLGDTRHPYDDVALYVKEHTGPGDRVFVWGYYPLIYVASDRLAATRFVGCHYLTGYAAIGLGRIVPKELEDRLGLPGGFEILVDELERHRAELVIDTAPADLHHWARYPLERYPTLAAYVAAHYQREAVVGGSVIYRRRPTRE